jgi:hypothetical protein
MDLNHVHGADCNHDAPKFSLAGSDFDTVPISRGPSASICSDGIDGHSHAGEGEVPAMNSHRMSSDMVVDVDQTARIHHLLHHLHNFSTVSR